MPTKDRSAEVVDFARYKNRALIDILDEVIEQAESGEINGAILILKKGRSSHGVAVVGDYENDAELICNISGELFVHFHHFLTKKPKVIK